MELFEIDLQAIRVRQCWKASAKAAQCAIPLAIVPLAIVAMAPPPTSRCKQVFAGYQIPFYFRRLSTSRTDGEGRSPNSCNRLPTLLYLPTFATKLHLNLQLYLHVHLRSTSTSTSTPSPLHLHSCRRCRPQRRCRR